MRNLVYFLMALIHTMMGRDATPDIEEAIVTREVYSSLGHGSIDHDAL